jgi:hypothetical protein
MTIINLPRLGHGKLYRMGGGMVSIYSRLEEMNALEYTCLVIALQFYKKPVHSLFATVSLRSSFYIPGMKLIISICHGNLP